MNLREETESALLANECKPENELAGRRRRGELWQVGDQRSRPGAER